MSHIMANARYNKTKAVEHVQVEDLVQLTMLDEVKAHLRHVDTM